MIKPWIQRIPQELKAADDTPLLGPKFDWEALEEALKQKFNIEKLTVQCAPWQWREEKSLFQKMGSKLNFYTFVSPPLEGEIFFALSEDDLNAIVSQLFHHKSRGPALFDEAFQEGLTTFLSLELLDIIEKIPPCDGLSMQSVAPLPPKETMLCQDIIVTMRRKKIFCRLFLSKRFRHALHQALPPPPKSDISLDLSLEIGQTTMPIKEWKETSPGDFIVLDRCLMHPHEGLNTLNITLNGHPLFIGKVEDDKIEIGEFFLETTKERDGMEEIQDELEEMEEAEEEIEEIEESEPLTKVEDVHLPIHVEIGRINLSLEKLEALQPGNFLDLKLPPDSNVDLVCNGNCIARGELVQIGDVLGVRILEIG